MTSILEKRQGFVNDDGPYDGDSEWWWYSSTATAIKWAVMALIFFLLLAWFVGGYYHAQRRMKKGLPPLAYHRWLLPRSQRARFEPHTLQPQNQFSFYQAHNGRGDSYGMHAFPPPAYNTHHVPPPTYQPPAGASKVDPSQSSYSIPPPTGEPSNMTSQDEGVAGTTAPTQPHMTGSRNPFR